MYLKTMNNPASINSICGVNVCLSSDRLGSAARSHTRCHHDDLGPAAAGEEHRAQLLRCGDQGARGHL